MVVPLMNLHIKSLGASHTVAGIIGELRQSIDLPKNEVMRTEIYPIYRKVL